MDQDSVGDDVNWGHRESPPKSTRAQPGKEATIFFQKKLLTMGFFPPSFPPPPPPPPLFVEMIEDVVISFVEIFVATISFLVALVALPFSLLPKKPRIAKSILITGARFTLFPFFLFSLI